MTAIHLLTAAVPLLQQLFPPVPLIKQVQDIPVLIGAVLLFCLAVAYLALWRAAPDYRVFRSLGIYTFAASVVQFLAYFEALVLSLSVRAVATGLLVEAAGEAMRVSNRRWTRFLWPVYVFAAFAVWFPSTVFLGDWSIGIAAVPLGILIVQGFRRGNSRDRMVAAAFSVYFFVRLTLLTSFERLTGIGSLVIIGNWHWSINSLTQSLLGATALTIFVRDLIRDRREKERLAAELAAGRAVQQVLIPEETPVIPGFNIQSVYKPFGEVGGDFFQIIATPSGGVLAIIGDVSGKGLPAAMTVSLLVGTVRTLAHYTQRPGEILAAMNHRMLARSDGGFTTCLVLRADPDGALTIANAGHIAPYLDGRELTLQNGLPLGISADTTYAESTFQIARSLQLTLLTDGVVEARNDAGELFGFERTRAISGESASQIAKSAELFGQDDDITVLTLTSDRAEAPSDGQLSLAALPA
jgi:serine phosphatase RsbU (regulator of sigma subunit)